MAESLTLTRISTKIHWIDTGKQLHEMIRKIQTCSTIAMDVEGDSLYHYRDKVCLIQISTPTENYILDPLAVSDISSLGTILSNPSIRKVFHASDYDIRSLNRDFGFSVSGLFDTKIAAELTGWKTLSLAGLLDAYFGITLNKKFQKYNWSRRPLPPEALKYACSDAEYLLELKKLLEKELLRMNRLSWAEEEFDRAGKVEWKPSRNALLGFRRIKNSKHLSPREQWILKAVWEWREKKAEARDLPPFKILSNETLLEIAKLKTQNPADIRKIRGFPRKGNPRWEREIHRILVRGREVDTADFPAIHPERNTRCMDRKLAEKIKEIRNKTAARLNLYPQIILSKNAIALLSAFGSELKIIPEKEIIEKTGIRNWQWNLIKDALLKTL